jgi:nitric oxide dioxygenase
MSPRQIELVQETWPRLAPIAGEAAERFCGDRRAQGRELMAMIGYAVKNLNRIEALRPGFEALGSRHAARGVRDEHYAAVGAALAWMLRKALGTALTAEVRHAWASAYGALAGMMK